MWRDMGSWVKIDGMHQPLRDVESLPENFQSAIDVHLLRDSRGPLSSCVERVHDQLSSIGCCRPIGWSLRSEEKSCTTNFTSCSIDKTSLVDYLPSLHLYIELVVPL